MGRQTLPSNVWRDELIERMRDRIESLETLLHLNTTNPHECDRPTFRMYGTSHKTLMAMLNMLLSRELVSKEHLTLATGYEARCLDVHVHRLRKFLRTYDVHINTEFGVGWYLTKENKIKLRNRINRHEDLIIPDEPYPYIEAHS